MHSPILCASWWLVVKNQLLMQEIQIFFFLLLGFLFFFIIIGGYFTLLWWFLPYIDMNQPWLYMCPLSRTPSHIPPHPIPLSCPSAPAVSALLHASNLDWRSISHMVIIYMFQYYSLKSSHPHLFPQSPKVCSLYLCFFCCLAYRVIVTIFINSIYMHLFFFLTYLTLYDRLEFHPPH